MNQEIIKGELVMLGLSQPLSVEEQIQYLKTTAEQFQQELDDYKLSRSD